VRTLTWPTSRLDVALLATVLLLGGASLVTTLAPALGTAIVHHELDVVLQTASALAAGAVGALAWARWREAGEIAALYQASAFLILAVLNAVTLAFALSPLALTLQMTPSDPGQLPVYILVGRRLAAGALLALGAIAALRGWDAKHRSVDWVVPGPLLALLGLLFVGAVLRDSLPPLLGEPAIAALERDPTGTVVALAGPLTIVQGIIGLIYVVVAYLYWRLHARDGQPLHAYLALGMVIAGFGQVHFAIHPGTYTSLVTTGDLIQMGFYLVVLIGVDAERRADLRELRRAHGELTRLHEAELTRAALEERARLAREVHDGLAQDLWYAKLKQGRLARLPALDEEGARLAAEVEDAIDTALADARQAVMALRPSPEGESLADTLHRYVEDFGDRFGLRVEFESDGELGPLAARPQAELLRIAQEALNNVRKHADATLVRVQVTQDDGTVSLVVTDNGRGFDPAAVGRERFGLAIMRERAVAAGGELAVASAPQDGTRITARVPVDA
jgi:signal transduction histidine kinase